MTIGFQTAQPIVQDKDEMSATVYPVQDMIQHGVDRIDVPAFTIKKGPQKRGSKYSYFSHCGGGSSSLLTRSCGDEIWKEANSNKKNDKELELNLRKLDAWFQDGLIFTPGIIDNHNDEFDDVPYADGKDEGHGQKNSQMDLQRCRYYLFKTIGPESEIGQFGGNGYDEMSFQRSFDRAHAEKPQLSREASIRPADISQIFTDEYIELLSSPESEDQRA